MSPFAQLGLVVLVVAVMFGALYLAIPRTHPEVGHCYRVTGFYPKGGGPIFEEIPCP